ncbi:MAG: pectate lyase [Ignavibacteriales bacterium]|nr:pectate lyase [Ignavibacteriales bacterium]
MMIKRRGLAYSQNASRVLSIALTVVASLLLTPLPSQGQTPKRIHWNACLWQPKKWYSGSEAIRIADNLLLYQHPSGGWPKNIDMAVELDAAQKEHLKAINSLDSSTIDNSATYTQLRYLAKVYSSTALNQFKSSFMRGIDYLLKAQYANGGWPQFYPLRQGYYSHITFNDDAMIGTMKLLNDVSHKHFDFAYIDEQRCGQARRAVEKGIECILRCQIRIGGQLTAWCAQHDEHDFSPAQARSYELPSLSGEECVGIVEFLMMRENPSDEIKTSVQSAITWFDKVQIKGIRVIEVTDVKGPAGRNRVVVHDTAAPSMWARFYDIGTNRGFFCSRNGIKRDSLSQISYERRNHYSWLGYWPQRLLEKTYPEWAKKHSLKNVLR